MPKAGAAGHTAGIRGPCKQGWHLGPTRLSGDGTGSSGDREG